MPNFNEAYKIGFFVADVKREPPHVHVTRDGNTVKYCINPLKLSYNRGYPTYELTTSSIFYLLNTREVCL